MHPKEQAMLKLEIDKQSCIECRKCIRVCPAHILYTRQGEKEVDVKDLSNCIRCGQCVAICPTGSVIHSEFPEEKVHLIDKELLPSPDSVEMLIRSRRSNRAFSSRPVPEEELKRILEAANRCPTATNSQELEFTIITDPAVLHQVSALTLEVFSGIVNKLRPLKPVLNLTVPGLVAQLPQFDRMIEQFSLGEDPILRGAKAAMFIHSDKGARFGKQDANMAYQNGSLMAESMGISQFYTGFVCVSCGMDRKKRLKKLLGIEGEIHAGMALGMPSFRFERYIDRKPVRVKWF